MNLQQKQSLIFNHYGLTTQLEKGIEEAEELIVEYKKMLNGGGSLEALLSEMADDRNMQEQIINSLGKMNRVNEIQHEKCDRQLKRMESEGCTK